MSSSPSSHGEIARPGSAASQHSCASSSGAYGHEPLETYKTKVIELCQCIGFGEPVEIEHMSGGSFNRVIGLTLGPSDCYPPTTREARKYVLRIPRHELPTEHEIDDFKDQVALLQYLHLNPTEVESWRIPVATVVAYDLTDDNPLGSQYVLQTRLPGRELAEVYYSLPENEKLEVADAVAEVMHKMSKIPFPHFGRVCAGNAIGDRARVLGIAEIDDAIRIRGFRAARRYDEGPVIPANEYLADAIRKLCDFQVAVMMEENAEEWYPEIQKTMMLKHIVEQMRKSKVLRDLDFRCRLLHWDFSVSNVLIDKVDGHWTVTGVLDWDKAQSVPDLLAARPPMWLWINEKDMDGDPDWDGDFDNLELMPEDLGQEQLVIKKHFDEAMKDHNPDWMPHAYGRGRWVRRLFKFVLNGYESADDWQRYDQLVNDWNAFYKERMTKPMGVKQNS